MDTIREEEVVIQTIAPEWYESAVSSVSMLRLDMLHPVISGNKWYKLKENLAYALANNYRSVLTFGGAFSNHLIATATAAQQYGLDSIGIVRGIVPPEKFTKTLQDCKQYGMQIHCVSREDYDKKTDPVFLAQLAETFSNPFIIPEGGANKQGREGAEEIAKPIPDTCTHICTAVGTGTTFAGLRNALPVSKKLIGFVPMKKGNYLQIEIGKHLQTEKKTNWQLMDDWHFGGFGKCNVALIDFMNSFYKQNNIPLDVVYTAKMMYGVQQLLLSKYFPENAQILCIHTGGLQGNASVEHKLVYR